MTIETRPGNVELVFQEDGTVNASITRHVFEDGVFIKTIGPAPLSGTDDPRFADFQTAFSASVLRERDQLREQLSTITSEKTDLESQLARLTTEKTELVAQIASLTTERTELRSELDQLQVDLRTANGDRATLAASLETSQSRVAELEAQLEELLHPPYNPRHVAPYVFLSRFRPEEIYAIQTSLDPTVVVGRAELQTIISYVDLDLQKTRDLVAYLEQSGVIAPGRSAALLADYSPE